MVKRILSLILAILMLTGTFSVAFPVSAANDAVMTKLVKQIKKFPPGKYWNHTGENNPDGVTSSPCSSHGYCDYWGNCSCNSFGGAIQCMGYANKVAYDLTGVDTDDFEERYTLNVSELCVGDVIRYGGNYHSICVVGVSGNKIAFTDCNYGSRCIIRWGVMDASEIDVDYVLHLKSNTMKNSDISFQVQYGGTADNSTINPGGSDTTPDEDVDTPDNVEVWQMSYEDSLNVRSKASMSGSIVGTIGAGQKFYVSAKSFDGEYLWAKITSGSVSGYCVLNYASYVSGSYESLKLGKLSSSYAAGSDISLSWNAIKGADSYELRLYDNEQELIKTYKTEKNSYKLSKLSAGKYSVQVTALSSVASSWSLESKLEALTVKGSVAVSGISIPKSGTLSAGGEGSIPVSVSPSNASNKSVTWKSSDKSILTIDSNGKMKALKTGVVTVTCTSKQNSKIKATCKVTVIPSQVTLRQNVTGTTDTSVALKWTKSQGASSYVIYRYNTKTKKYDLLTQTKSLKYIDKGLKASTKYTYAVRGVAKINGKNELSKYEAISAYTAANKITSIKQNGSDTGRIRFTWSKQANVTSYVIFKYNTSTKKWYKLVTTKNNYYIDKDKSGTKVYYKVTAATKTTGGYVYSEYSDTFSGYTGLNKPTVKTQTNSSKVKLSWNTVGAATHYEVYRLQNGKYVKLATVKAGTNSYLDSGLKSGTSYTYAVRALRVHSSTLKLYSSNTVVKAKTAS